MNFLEQYKQILSDMGLIEKTAKAPGRDGTFTAVEKARYNQLNAQKEDIEDNHPDVIELIKNDMPTTGVPFRKQAPSASAKPDPKPEKTDLIFTGSGRIEAVRSQLRCLTGTNEEIRHKTITLGHFLRAVSGNFESQAWLRENGVGVMASQQEGVNTQGGYLVPTTLYQDLIKLVFEYGVFRKNARYRELKSDTGSIPRRTGGLTAHFVGETEAGTASTMTWDSVSVTARKLMTLCTMSNELLADTMIALADEFLDETALAFAQKEDECGFNGTGISTYGGIIGVNTKLSSVNGVDDGGGLVLATGNLFSEFTLADFCKMISRIPSYARARSKWYCSPAFYGQTMLQLMTAAGGNDISSLMAGATAQRFLNYPIEFSEVLPTSDSNSQIACLFGDLSRAASFADRQTMSIATSGEATVDGSSVFERDMTAFRGIERFDINVHDVGTSTAAGPIVGLISAAA